MAMQMRSEFKKGQVRWFASYDGRDNHNSQMIKKDRPVLIVSDDEFNSISSVVTVVPLTSRIKGVDIIGLGRDSSSTHVVTSIMRGKISTIEVEQIFAVGKDLLGDPIGTLEWYVMEYVDICIDRLFGHTSRQQNKRDKEALEAVVKMNQAELEQKLRQEIQNELKQKMKQDFEDEFEVYKDQHREEIRAEIMQELLSEQKSRMIERQNASKQIAWVTDTEIQSKTETKVKTKVETTVETKVTRTSRWTEESKAEFMKSYVEIGPVATAEKYGMKKSSAQVLASQIRHGR